MSTMKLIFDLDGTLVDSAIIVGDILNEMRAESGKTPLGTGFYRLWSSRGGAQLVGHALEIPPAQANDHVVDFRRRYHGRKTPIESVFPTTHETLSALADAGYALAICSNKPSGLCVKVLHETGLDRYFRLVLGGDSLPKSKPDPASLLYTLEKLSGNSDQALMIGDSTVDQRTADAANIRFVFFSAGYDDGVKRERAFAIINRLEQIKGVLG